MSKQELSFEPAETLYPVEPADLRKAWVSIRDKVTAIALKCNENWIADDVFHEIVTGNAFLWASPSRDGFVVLRLFRTAYSSDLFVWLAFKDKTDLSEYFLPQLLEIASTNGCSRVTWESPRPWNKILPNVKRAYTFSIEVGDAQ